MEGEGKAFLAFSCFTEGFASAEATKGLSDRTLETFGPMQRTGFSIESGFFVEGEGKAFLAFSCFTEGFDSSEATKELSDRPLETFGPMQRMGFSTENGFFVEGEGKAFLAFSCFTEGFASAEATRGLFHRPLDPFGGTAIRFRKPLLCFMCSKQFFDFPKRITETVANLPPAQPPLFSISYALHMPRDSSLFRFTMKSCALVTIPRAERLPRSLSLFTVNSEISTQ